jgi:hypothetical protein
MEPMLDWTLESGKCSRSGSFGEFRGFGSCGGEADPPFDFAQGRLFEDDRKKGKGNGKSEDFER